MKYVEYQMLLFSRKESKKVNHNDPLKVEIPDFCEGFRFYEKNSKGERINTSCWYFVGKRLRETEIKRYSYYSQDSRYQKILSDMKEKKISSVCITQNGSILPMESNDMTFEEYKQNLENEREKSKELRKLRK